MLAPCARAVGAGLGLVLAAWLVLACRPAPGADAIASSVVVQANRSAALGLVPVGTVLGPVTLGRGGSATRRLRVIDQGDRDVVVRLRVRLTSPAPVGRFLAVSVRAGTRTLTSGAVGARSSWSRASLLHPGQDLWLEVRATVASTLPTAGELGEASVALEFQERPRQVRR